MDKKKIHVNLNSQIILNEKFYGDWFLKIV